MVDDAELQTMMRIVMSLSSLFYFFLFLEELAYRFDLSIYQSLSLSFILSVIYLCLFLLIIIGVNDNLFCAQCTHVVLCLCNGVISL